MMSWLVGLNAVAGPGLSRLWHASVEGAVALGAAWLLCRAFARVPARFKCWLWRLAYGKLLLALFWVGPVNIPLLPARQAEPSRLPSAAARLAGGAHASFPNTAGRAAAPVRRTLPLWILAAWISGVLARSMGLRRQWVMTARLRAAGRRVNDPEANDYCAQLSEHFGLARAPGLLTTEQVFRPLLMGLADPAVLLPNCQLVGPGRASLRLAVAHELAHLKRRDLWWNWLPVLSTTLFWFHPLAWACWREWRLVQEIACDELAVLGSRASIPEYARMLLQASRSPAPPVTLGIAGTVSSYRNLKGRLSAMAHFGSCSRPLALVLGSLLMLGGGVGLVPWKAVARTGGNPPPEARRDRPGRAEEAPAPVAPTGGSLEVAWFGTIEPNAKIELRALTGGGVEQVGFQEGGSVRKGQLLVQLANPGLKAELAAAAAEFKESELEYQRLQAVAEKHPGLLAAGSLEQAQSAMAVNRAKLELKQTQLSQTRVVAPWDGVIGSSALRPGETVTPNTILGSLYDFSSFKVRFAVSADYIASVKKGQKVQVQIESDPPEELEGEISFVAPAIDEETRKVEVRANLSKPKHHLWPGEYAKVIAVLPRKGSGGQPSPQAPPGPPSRQSSRGSSAATNAALPESVDK